MLPYFTEDQLHAIKGNSFEEVSRLILTVKLAWAALERKQKELDDASTLFNAGLNASVEIVRSLAEEVFNVKVPPQSTRL